MAQQTAHGWQKEQGLALMLETKLGQRQSAKTRTSVVIPGDAAVPLQRELSLFHEEGRECSAHWEPQCRGTTVTCSGTTALWLSL